MEPLVPAGAPRRSRSWVVQEGRSRGPPGDRPLPPRLFETPRLPSPAARHIWFHSGPPPPPGALLPLSSPLSEKQRRFLKTQSHTHAEGVRGKEGKVEKRGPLPCVTPGRAPEVGQVGSALPGRATVSPGGPGRPKCRPPRRRTQCSR